MLLEIKGLTKRFGGLLAVSNLSFSMESGDIVGIFGPNGSGKTTTLSLIAGIIPLSSGELLWKGVDIARLKPYQIAQLGIVKTFQNPQLFPELTVRDHMRIAAHLHFKRALGYARIYTLFMPWINSALETSTQSRIDKILELCRLQHNAHEPAAALSYGTEKMLGVAMALMCEPELLLLDEPASGLGQDEIINLEAVLRDLRDVGVSQCIIDHKVGFLGRLADRSVALAHGVKIAEGITSEVLQDDAVITAYLGKKHA